MAYPGEIVTARLRLRRPVPGDAVAVFEEYASDPEVTRFLTWHAHRDLEETRAFLGRCAAGWESGRDLTWGLTVPPDNRVIGMIGCRPDGHKTDIGYVLGRRHWHRGYMTEAGRALVAVAFQDPVTDRVWATCDVANVASARVLERIGMRREGVLRSWIRHPNLSDAPRDSFAYAIVRADFEPRPSA